jgi:hypothetical protein
MNDIYVWQPEGQPVGPFTTESLARAIADGSVAKDAFVAPPGAAQWQHASQLPEVLGLVEGMLRAKSPSILPPRSPVAVAPVIPAAPKVPQAPRAPQPPKAPRPPMASQSGVRTPSSAPPANADAVLSMPSSPAPESSIAALSAALLPAPTPAPVPTPIVAQAPAILPAPDVVQAPPVSPAATAVMPAIAFAKVEPVKPAEDKPKAKPWPKWIPLAVFGAFLGLSLVELAVGIALAPKDTVGAEVGQGASSGAPAAAHR